MKILLKLMLGLMLLGSYNVAHANDYVCKVTYIPTSGTVGRNGYIFLFRYSAPECGGVFVGSNVFCTNSATYGPCATESYHYSERGILALKQSLLSAAENNTRITVSGASCMNGGSGCGAYVNYFDD